MEVGPEIETAAQSPATAEWRAHLEADTRCTQRYRSIKVREGAGATRTVVGGVLSNFLRYGDGRCGIGFHAFPNGLCLDGERHEAAGYCDDWSHISLFWLFLQRYIKSLTLPTIRLLNCIIYYTGLE